MEAKDHGPVLVHGDGPNDCDKYGARDVWVWEDDGKYYMHYDAAGPKGWLVAVAESTDLINWEKKGTVLDLGTTPALDSASASYGTTYQATDGDWHMFYLGTPNVTPPPDRIPAFPYLTMKAKSQSPIGPWTKQYDVTPFRPVPGTYYQDTASPGHIIKHKTEFLQFFSASKSDESRTRRTLGLARTKDLNGPWSVDPHPIVPLEEQIENSTMYYEPENQTWFLFTNHIGTAGVDGPEYTDAIWVYWTKDPTYWDARCKAVVLDGSNCTWATTCIGLPSVVKHGKKLALFYDAPKGGGTSHMGRDVGLAWLDLPLSPPSQGRIDTNGSVISGLDIKANGDSITVSPGAATVGSKEAKLYTTATLLITAGTQQSIKGEQMQLPPEIIPAWISGGHLAKLKTANVIPGALVPESLQVRLPDGALLKQGTDYVAEGRWGKLACGPSGRVSTETQVLVDYKFGLLRLDGVDILPDGMVITVTGVPDFVCPTPPPVTTGGLRLANIFRPYNSQKVESWHIFVAGQPFPEPTQAEKVQLSQPVRQTLAKLRAGKPVHIVTWGDSVTAGGDASKPELAYANLFITRLRERFPKAAITHTNSAIGGTNTSQRLPDFEKEVLAHKPDLVTMEFVNDMNFPVSELQKNWNQALTQVNASGAEAVVITPHFTMPEFMGNAHPRGTEVRQDVRWLKLIAKQNAAGLADTSRRWAHLETEGVPYITLLHNGINHPNDRGHEMFVKDLMSLFPLKD